MQQIDTALLISLGIELNVAKKQEKAATEPLSKSDDSPGLEILAEKIKLQTEVERVTAQLEVYKDLYNGLLSQIVSNRTEG